MISIMLLLSLSTAPSHLGAPVQAECPSRPFLLRIRPHAIGIDEELVREEEDAWRQAALPILRQRCPLCSLPDNARDLEEARAADERIGTPSDIRPPPPRTVRQPTEAIFRIEVTAPRGQERHGKHSIRAFWTQYADSALTVVSPSDPLEFSRRPHDEGGIVHELLNNLRRLPEVRCFIRPQRDRGLRLFGRLGVWTDAVITERDLTGVEDVRLGSVSLGLADSYVISASTRVRARLEVGRGGFYISEGGESWLNAASFPLPGNFWVGGLGADLVYTPQIARGAHVFAGLDVRAYSEGRQPLQTPAADWHPYAVIPWQADVGLAVGAGTSWPTELEVTARRSAPNVKFIADDRDQPVWELSIVARGPFLSTLIGGR